MDKKKYFFRLLTNACPRSKDPLKKLRSFLDENPEFVHTYLFPNNPFSLLPIPLIIRKIVYTDIFDPTYRDQKLQLLIERGASIEAPCPLPFSNNDIGTPIHYLSDIMANDSLSLSYLQILFTAGANPNARTKDKKHAFELYLHPQYWKLLLENGADPFSPNLNTSRQDIPCLFTKTLSSDTLMLDKNRMDQQYDCLSLVFGSSMMSRKCFHEFRETAYKRTKKIRTTKEVIDAFFSLLAIKEQVFSYKNTVYSDLER